MADIRNLPESENLMFFFFFNIITRPEVTVVNYRVSF